MGISPWFVGQTRPVWSITWTDDSGTAIDLTGATVTLRFSEYVIPLAGYDAQGVVDVTTPLEGKFTYAPAADDFAASGSYTVQAKAVFGDDTVLEADLLFITVEAQV